MQGRKYSGIRVLNDDIQIHRPTKNSDLLSYKTRKENSNSKQKTEKEQTSQGKKNQRNNSIDDSLKPGKRTYTKNTLLQLEKRTL